MMKPNIKYSMVPDDIKEYVCSSFNLNGLQSGSFLFGAFSGDEPVGLISGSVVNESVLSISFISVTPVMRDSGIGSSMIKSLAGHCKLMGIGSIIVKYDSSGCDIQRLERFLNRTLPGVSEYEYSTFRVTTIAFGKNFIKRFFPEAEFNVTGQDRVSVKYLEELDGDIVSRIDKESRNMVASYLLPLPTSRFIVKEISVFAFINDTIIGWSVADRTKYDNIHIRSTFVRPEYRTNGTGAYLWSLIFKKFAETAYLNNIVKYISFDFDRNENRINNLYEILFGRYIIERTEHYIRKALIM